MSCEHNVHIFPFIILRDFCTALYVPGARYHDFFCRLMWRSARADVAEQLRLPPQHEHSKLLEFSDIEAYYYERQHRECLTAAQDVLRKYPLCPLQL